MLSFFCYLAAWGPAPAGFARTTIVRPAHTPCDIYMMVHKEFHLTPPPGLDAVIQEWQNWLNHLNGLPLPADPAELAELNDKKQKAQNKIQNLQDVQQDIQNNIAGYSQGDLNRLISAWDESIENVWNDGGRTLGCCSVRILLNYRIREPDGAATPGYDQIGVVLSNRHRSYVSGLGGFDADGFAAGAYANDMSGFWGAYPRVGESHADFLRMPPHEVGHELGLNDEYEEDGTPKAGHAGDLMAELTGSARGSDIEMILNKLGVGCTPACCRAPDPVPAGTDGAGDGTPDPSTGGSDPTGSGSEPPHDPHHEPDSPDTTSSGLPDNTATRSGDSISTGTDPVSTGKATAADARSEPISTDASAPGSSDSNPTGPTSSNERDPSGTSKKGDTNPGFSGTDTGSGTDSGTNTGDNNPPWGWGDNSSHFGDTVGLPGTGTTDTSTPVDSKGMRDFAAFEEDNPPQQHHEY